MSGLSGGITSSLPHAVNKPAISNTAANDFRWDVADVFIVVICQIYEDENVMVLCGCCKMAFLEQ